MHLTYTCCQQASDYTRLARREQGTSYARCSTDLWSQYSGVYDAGCDLPIVGL